MLTSEARAVAASLAVLRGAGLIDSGIRPMRPLSAADRVIDTFTRSLYSRIESGTSKVLVSASAVPQAPPPMTPTEAIMPPPRAEGIRAASAARPA